MKTQAIAVSTQAVNLQPATYSRKCEEASKRHSTTTAFILSVVALVAIASYASAQELPPLTLHDESHAAHILPTRGNAILDKAQPPGAPLLYHGGPVMKSVTTGSPWSWTTEPIQTYAIFWAPASGQLQNGAPTSLPTQYQWIEEGLLSTYLGHGIGNNNTQYYTTCATGLIGDFTCFTFWPGFQQFIENTGALGAAYVDTSSYPTAGCTDPLTGNNCISDAQIQAEIQRVMQQQGWTGGLNHLFVLFTSSGEGSCFKNGGNRDSCSYVGPINGTGYCGYHSYINANGSAIIYANLPYGNPTYCQTPGTPSPHNDPAADSAASVTSHEISEAITDPLLNAWWEPAGGEIGDKCLNYYNSSLTYGTNSWDLQGGTYLANQMWSGVFYELQTEYDNHTGSCVQVGP
jgi:hypothetical protein